MKKYFHRASGSYIDYNELEEKVSGEYVFGNWTFDFIEMMDGSLLNKYNAAWRRRGIITLGEMGDQMFLDCISGAYANILDTIPKLGGGVKYSRNARFGIVTMEIETEARYRLRKINKLDRAEDINVLIASFLINPELRSETDFAGIKKVVDKYGVYEMASLITSGISWEDMKLAAENEVDNGLVLTAFRS